MKLLPRTRFAHLPTPLEPLARLSAHLNGPRIWIKRDDQTGLALGGNKTRKLEYLVAEALAHGARTLITGGAIQSNHCRQTAAAAAKFGLDCVLVLGLSTTGGNLPDVSGNLLLDKLLNAEFVWAHPGERDKTLKAQFELAWEQGRRPYLIPYGGSNPTGAVGYALAAQELLEQCQNSPDIPYPNWICIASSSGGTQAGLVAGSHLFKSKWKILGISIDEDEAQLKEKVASLATNVCDLLAEPHTFLPKDVIVNDHFIGAGYGVLSDAEKQAIKIFAKYEGILLDPVYTGRAAAGILALVQDHFFSKEENIVFWHTGGSPALFAEQYSTLVGSSA
jgi:D-cysteine desulfhydrase family pyridoxal phosphate-dependent enzyme